MTPSLQEFGWTDRLEGLYEASIDELPLTADERSALFAARVSRQDRHRYQLLSGTGPRAGEVSARFVTDHSDDPAQFPAVGDWVIVSPRPASELVTIHRVLPRASSFSRKVAGATTREQVVAANIDTVFLVSGLDNDFNLRRIERYVTLAWNSGATPVVVLNKADLVSDIPEKIAAVSKVAIGIDVIAVSTMTDSGTEPLSPYLVPGKTVALLGSSGVGKSSIVNHILGKNSLQTTAVREDDSRGRHTTTFRELFITPGGTLLVDTPGMRELQLWAEEEDVQQTFAEIEELATQCRFADCAHESEPGCAIQQAIEDGRIDPARFASYLKLMREVAFLDRRKAESTFAQRKHEKSLHKMYKDVQKHNRKNKRN